MKPRIQLDTAPLPDGGQLQLFKRDTEFSIMLGNIELMNSRLSKSEEALATLVCERLKDRPSPKLLIGGLGMGFTLRAALAISPPGARIVVSEIVPELVDWAGDHMAAVFGNCLADPRVVVETRDVGAMIREAASGFDAILLDVDNGPDGLTRPGNDALYSEAGLKAARRALAPGGVLAIWSAAPAPAFPQRLSRCGFEVATHTVRASSGKRGNRHTIWIAARKGG